MDSVGQGNLVQTAAHENQSNNYMYRVWITCCSSFRTCIVRSFIHSCNQLYPVCGQHITTRHIFVTNNCIKKCITPDDGDVYVEKEFQDVNYEII
jgi:hypothetical protein